MPAPKQPQDRKPSAEKILSEGRPFDWTVGDTTLTLPPAKDIPGGWRLVMRAMRGDLDDAQLLDGLIELVKGDVPEIDAALDRSTINEGEALMTNWLRVDDLGEADSSSS